MKKQNFVANVAISLISLALISCNGSKEVTENENTTNKKEETNQQEMNEVFLNESKPEEVFEPEPEEKKSNQTEIKQLTYNPKLIPDMLGAHYDIENAELSGNQLYITIAYSGGCKEHEFNLYHNKMISKSMPPILNIFLTHENNGDECEQYITKTIIFDVSTLEKDFPELKQIKLQLSNFGNTLMYNK
jgi:hypothetical protein